jgi:hypothetical protein
MYRRAIHARSSHICTLDTWHFIVLDLPPYDAKPHAELPSVLPWPSVETGSPPAPLTLPRFHACLHTLTLALAGAGGCWRTAAGPYRSISTLPALPCLKPHQASLSLYSPSLFTLTSYHPISSHTIPFIHTYILTSPTSIAQSIRST